MRILITRSTRKKGLTRLPKDLGDLRGASLKTLIIKLIVGNPAILIRRENRISNHYLRVYLHNRSRVRTSTWEVAMFKLREMYGSQILKGPFLEGALYLNSVIGPDTTPTRCAHKNKISSTKSSRSHKNQRSRKSFYRSSWKLTIRSTIRLAEKPWSRSQKLRTNNSSWSCKIPRRRGNVQLGI